MKELFQWVPWFRELAKAVREGRQADLVERAKKVDWAGGRCAVLAQGEDKADPLTFFYHLASVAGGKAEKRETVYASVADVFEIESALDYSHKDGFIFPTPPGLQVLFNNSGADPGLLWKMFHQAHAFDGTSDGTDSADTFARTLQVRGIGVPKLTQVLFLINPHAFLPFDQHAVLPLGIGAFKKHPASISWDEYIGEMGRIRATFPGCECYEINVIGYLWTSESLPRKGNRWYQIDTSEDGWRDFRVNHWVHHGGQGDIGRPGEGELLPEPKQDARFDEPEPGDVILVRTGTQEGRGIGIVYRNDYGEQPHENDRIHVLWVNKKQAPLAVHMPAIGFSRVGRTSYEAFAKSTYSETLTLLQPPNGTTSVPPTNDPSGKDKDRSFTSVIQSLKAQGLHFPREAVANYFLALQSKRFAILTGISGTGKTKIAKAVAEHFQPVTQGVPDDAVEVEVKPSYIKDAKLVLPVSIGTRLGIPTQIDPGPGPQIWVRYPSGRIRLGTYLAAGKYPMPQFKGDIKEWLQTTLKVGDRFWLRVHPAETDDPSELEIGLPGPYVRERIDNYKVIPVRPDWVDNRGLLGYLNPITNEYSTTPFLNLLLRARAEEERAARPPARSPTPSSSFSTR